MRGKDPDWDPASPAESMCRQADWFLEEACATFLKSGTHVELFFFYSQDGQGGMGSQPPEMSREQFTQALRQTIHMNDIFGVVHILEAWVFIPKHPNDHTMKQILAGEIAVSGLKKGDKTEALVVRYECRDGNQRMWINPILRPKNGVALADPVEMGDDVSGRFGSLF